ncbi:MAG: methyltransferase domain-containing protein [Planctomycetes bacterium]|nr:methyltransferase domain-containing protein [Planctomycetota bacterium]
MTKHINIHQATEVLRNLYRGFQASRVILTANKYGIFDHVQSPKTAKEIAKAVRADARALEILLDAVTSLGFLQKSGSKYKNTPLSDALLVQGKPFYQGDALRHADSLYQNWSGLDKVVKTVRPYHKADNHASFIKAMHNMAILKARKIVQSIDLRGVKTVLDLGGGPGTYAMEFARKGAAVTLFDFAETIRIARNIVGKSGVKNIKYLPGNFKLDSIGKNYDLIFISQILHAYSDADCRKLMLKCAKALNPGGRIVIQEFRIAEDRAHPAPAALFSINMLVNTAGGRSYTPVEMKNWLVGAGLKNVKIKPIGDNVLVYAKNEV